ncbi:MAG: hypothetical protein EBR60_11340 [Burkholderiaceae bacterium]|nr:hypothetical protein [Burkholderiaceae bacterium]
MNYLRENLSFDQARMVVESDGQDGKNLYMKGICIQGGIKNANQRVYPVDEIERAVKTLNDQITGGYSVLGEVDHPDDLKINLDRVSHMITEMWMDGPNGYGKFKILPTPMGEIITVDVVAQPSAPGAYPTPIYEHIMNARGGHNALRIAKEVKGDPKAQKYIKESLLSIISKLH